MNVDPTQIDLANVLHLAVLRWCQSDLTTFRIVGDLPDWWTSDLGKVDNDVVRIVSPFLVDYLGVAAANVWDSSKDACQVSPLFELQERAPLQAIVTKQNENNVLVIRNLNAFDEWLTDVLQNAREQLIHRETERSSHKKVVAEISADRDEARRQEELKSRVLANMSHEIRTPLSTILGMVEIAQKKNSDPHEQLEAIGSAAKQLLCLGNDILDLSKMQVEKLELDRQTIEIDSFVKSLEREWQYHAGEKGLEFLVRCDSRLPAHVQSDEFRLRQVITNLVGNAIKFTETGKVALSVERLDNDLVRFEVEDTGTGIAEDDLPLIFDAFSQVDPSKRRKHQGAGLGLAIANRLVRLMGGSINVASKLGKGTRFWFDVHLPIAKHAEANAEYEDADSETHLNGLSILVADDHATNRSILVDILESVGANVTDVSNGKEAVEYWKQNRFDLVIMDCQMPVMSGIDAIALIREAEAASERIPILALTAFAMKAEKEKVIQIGADRCVTKPYEQDELIRIVDQLSRRNKASSSP